MIKIKLDHTTSSRLYITNPLKKVPDITEILGGDGTAGITVKTWEILLKNIQIIKMKKYRKIKTKKLSIIMITNQQ